MNIEDMLIKKPKQYDLYVKKDENGLITQVDIKENIENLNEWEYWKTTYVTNINALKNSIQQLPSINIEE